MATAMRKTGIDVVGDMPWGTHFCLFYETTEDLLRTLVPYCKTGLESQEFCLWVVAAPLTVENARQALKQAIPEFDRYSVDGSIEIVAARDWYLQDGTFDLVRVVSGWNEKLARASARGYAGVRVTGDTAWLEKKDWKDFCEYEDSLNQAITNQRLAVLCTYPLAACGGAEILDVVRTHQFAVTRRRGNWDIIETAGHKQAKAEIKRLNEELEQRVLERTSQLTAVNEELTKEVSERLRAEGALLRSEAYLADAQTLTHTGSFGWRPSTGEIIWSEETFQIFEYDRTTKPTVELVLQRVYPEDAALVKQTIERASQDAKDFEHEHRLLMPDGSIKYVRVLAHASRDKSGGIEFVGAVSDVTPRRRAEEALRKSEERWRSVFENSAIGVALTDLNGRFLTTNHVFQTMTGYTEEELRALSFLDVTHEDYREANWALITELLEGKRRQFQIEKKYRRKDGSLIWVSNNVSLVPGTDRVPQFIMALSEDIAERKRAEEKLRRSEADLLEAQRISQTGSWKLDVSSGTVTVSPQVFRIFGVKPDENTSTPEFWFSRNHLEDQKRIQELFERSKIQKTDYDADYRIVLPDGAIKHLHAVGHPALNESGDLVEFVGTVMDITERKQAEEALRRSEGYLAEAQKLTHTGSWAWNVRTGALFWSQEIFRIYNYDPREIGLTWPQFLERVHPEDRPQIEQSAKMQASEKEWVDSQNDFRIVLPDGTIKHLHSVAHPVRDGSGEITEVVGTVMDVTEQWKARTELERAFEENKRLKDRLHDENIALREQIDQTFMFEEIVGSSPALQTVLSSIVKVAPTDSTVLITGETGTGKELIARAIHKHSHRCGQAFISVNCASIPSSLIASELFGHEKGAFTGAVQRRQGRFELAHSGTIFLDEVGELPAETQIALLRVLQERQFERVGGNRVLTTDVRVIAATNRDLTAAIAAGTFRADLFYRLNVFPIEVPPLRRRKEDIPMLVEYFVKRYAEKTGKQIRKIEKNTLELCQSYSWPGNIRELQNIVERSVILCNNDTFWIEKAWLASEQARRPELSGLLPDTLQNQEKEIIEAALAESKGKIAGPEGAAAKLGIPRSTLDSKIKQLNIKKQKFIAS